MKHYGKYIAGLALITGAVILLGWRRRVARTAIDFIDIEEVGNNQGWTSKVFEQMMKSIGWKSGEAWCMYFAKSVYMGAFKGSADKIDKILTGSTQGSLAAAKNSDLFTVITTPGAKPKRGDIIIWQSTKNAGLGHAGIAYKPSSGDQWITIEGNSSLDGAREGQGVVKGDRKLIIGATEGTLKVVGYIRKKLF